MPTSITPKNTKCMSSTFSKVIEPENCLILRSLKKLNYKVIRLSMSVGANSPSIFSVASIIIDSSTFSISPQVKP